MRLFTLAVVTVIGCGRHGFDPLAGDGAGLDDASTDGAVDSSVDPDAMPDGMPVGALTASFTRLAPSSAPTARRSSGAAIQPNGATDRLWTFGGYLGAAGTNNDLFSVDTSANAWIIVAGTAPPSIRERHAMAWDPVGNAVVVFGGSYTMLVNPTFYDALYVYRPATNAWTQIPKIGNWPVARHDSTLVWVPSLGKFLLYGGANGGGAGNRLGDLWLLTLDAVGGTGSWMQLTPGGVTAPAQSAACIAYDAGARRMFLFGGELQDGASTNTTYQYLVDTNTWQADATIGATPPGESFNQCAWDPAIARLVVYGGQLSAGGPTAGTYTYDPATKKWEQPPVQGANPGARADGGAAYSPALGRLIWFGGRTGTTTYTNETWTLDLTYQ